MSSQSQAGLNLLSAIVLLGLVRQSCTYTVGEKEERIISRKFTDYNHQYNEQKLQTQFISVTAKRKAADDISSRPSKICRDVIKENLQSHLNVTDLRQNTFHIYYRGIKRNIYNARRSRYPSLPRCIDDVQWGVRNFAHQFVCH
jgi:hypothetical protein